MILLDVVVGAGDAALLEGLSNRAGDGLRRVPHAVKDDDGPLFDGTSGPFLIAGEDIVDVGAPDDAVPCGDHVDLEPVECLEGCLSLAAVEHQDVGVVFLGFEEHGRQIVFVVEALGGGEVLAKGIVGEQDLLLGAVGDHAVRPMKHRCRNELQGAAADIDGIVGVDALIGEIAIAGGESLQPIGQARDDLGVGTMLHHERDGPGVIGLDMAGDDVVDPGGIDDGGDTREQLGGKGFFDRIDERDLLVENQICVIGGAASRLVAMETAHGPVDGADPVDVFTDFNCLHDVGLAFKSYFIGKYSAI